MLQIMSTIITQWLNEVNGGSCPEEITGHFFAEEDSKGTDSVFLLNLRVDGRCFWHLLVEYMSCFLNVYE
jgi:hypothetical protein